MKIEAERRNNEPFERLFRRFNRKIQESGVLTSAKEKRFFSREPNRHLRREGAIRREVIRKARYQEYRKRGVFR
ncbi:MAG: 30S ribosomal protein S21 [Candidatus Berkelbacteria bacterium]|nr:30S ribosomal protein S21 [Candidatus Berkelbacteria bacterium]